MSWRIHHSLAVLALFTAVALRAQQPAPEPLQTAGERPVDIAHLRLDLKVDLPKRTLDGRAAIDFRTLRPLREFDLDAVDFEVKSVRLGGAAAGKDESLRFRHDGKRLQVDLPAEWPADKTGRLLVEYRVREPKDGLFFFGPSDAEPDVPLTAWTQGEPVSNRYWFPCLDRPNVRQSTELVVTVADGFEVLSNGKLVEKRSNPDQTVTFHWKQEKPHVSYLVTLVVGKFDIVREDWNGKEVSYYVPRGKKKDVARTFGKTRAMLDFYGRRFGVDYPWEKYAQVVVEQFTAGGMENTSATTLHDSSLHDERALLDSNADGLIAHELAHQWWGDLVTCRDWAHLWLNEGWASFCEVLWAEHDLGADEAAYDLLHKARAAISGGKQRPVVDRRYPHPNTMFDARAYPKGAFVLHMLRRMLGEDAFWKGVRTYLTEHKYQSVETADFRRALERVSGRDLERFFYDWTERPGNPALTVHVEPVAESKLTKVTIKQTQPGEPFRFDLPLGYSAGGPDQKGARHQEKLPVREKEQTFYLKLPEGAGSIEIDPDQTVLAEVTEEKSREAWRDQLKAGSTVAVRARAAAHFGKSKSPADRELLAEALKEETFWGAAAEVAQALGESGGDTSRDALAAGLNHAHPKVRRACADQLGKFPNDDKAAAALREVLKKGDASYFVEAAALGSYAKQRRPDTAAMMLPWLAKPSQYEILRTTALDGLARSQDLSALDTLVAWTKRGKPRNARTAALRGLAELSRTANPSEDQRKAIVAALAACLDGEGPHVRRTAVGSLRELGRSAAPSVSALEAIARHDPDPGIQEQAKRAVEAIRSNAPAPVEVTRLREELEKLKRENESLRDRFERFEKQWGKR